MTHKQARSLDAIADATIDVLRKSLAPLDARLAALEARLSAVEARPVPKWCGVPRAGGIGHLAIDRQVGVVMTHDNMNSTAVTQSTSRERKWPPSILLGE